MGFSNGENLNIIIGCEYLPHHNWMSFAAWYSISKKMPDAKVLVSVVRGYPQVQLFSWARKYGVPLVQHCQDFCLTELFDDTKKNICVVPSVMAVRDYDDNFLGPVAAKSDELTTLVDYSTGCGQFVMADWINSIESPFDDAVKGFTSGNMTANEIAVLKIWERIASLYAM